MDNSLFIIGVVAYLASAFISRIVGEKAYRALDEKQMSAFVTSFSRHRQYQLLPVIVLLVVFFLLIERYQFHRAEITIAYFVLLAIFIVIMQILVQRRIRSLELPSQFSRPFLISRIIQNLGLGVMFICLLYATVSI